MFLSFEIRRSIQTISIFLSFSIVHHDCSPDMRIPGVCISITAFS